MLRTLRFATLAVCGALVAYVAFPDRAPVTGLLLDSRDGRLMFADDGDAVQPAGDATRLLMAHLLAETTQAPSTGDVRRLEAPGRPVATLDGPATAAAAKRVDYQTPGFISEVRGDKVALAGRLNRRAADLGLHQTRFSLSGDVLSGVTTARDLAEVTRAVQAPHAESSDALKRQGKVEATPGAIQHISGLPCRLPGRGAACQSRPAEGPVVAIVLGDGVDSISDVLTLAGLTWQVVRNVVGGRDVALVQTLASGPPPRDPAPPLRIELV